MADAMDRRQEGTFAVLPHSDRLVPSARSAQTGRGKLPIAMAQAPERTIVSDARRAILELIASRRATATAVPDYELPVWTADPVAHFIAKAKASVAKVHELTDMQDAPARILSILTQSNAPRRLH